jgi:hypothetical protein
VSGLNKESIAEAVARAQNVPFVGARQRKIAEEVWALIEANTSEEIRWNDHPAIDIKYVRLVTEWRQA